MNVYIGRPQKQCLQNKIKIKSLRKERIHSAIIPSKTVIKPLVIFYIPNIQTTKKMGESDPMKYLKNKLIPPLEMNNPTPILNQILQQLRSNHALRYKDMNH